MGLEADFNTAGYKTYKINDYVLGISYPYAAAGESNYNTFHSYDFLARVLTSRSGSSEGGTAVTPFSQLDPDSLEAMRQRLIALGGKPPELMSDNPGKQPKSGPALRP